MGDLGFITFPFLLSVMDKNDLFPDFEHRIHIVGIDYSRHIIFVGDFVNQIIDHDRSQGIQARIRFVTKQEFRL